MSACASYSPALNELRHTHTVNVIAIVNVEFVCADVPTCQDDSTACKNINAAACYNSITRSSCCQTCAKFHTGTPGLLCPACVPPPRFRPSTLPLTSQKRLCIKRQPDKSSLVARIDVVLNRLNFRLAVTNVDPKPN